MDLLPPGEPGWCGAVSELAVCVQKLARYDVLAEIAVAFDAFAFRGDGKEGAVRSSSRQKRGRLWPDGHFLARRGG